ncbi:ATP-binding protein [Prosthecobacter sp.]|uniref:ATP-binding protein n=1 Tax=Prosthecobacter sp. TaxID=1965333 RepID=UPI002489C569|nr:ATP-binding protein [Prosthecobacter sp.]MDI1313868.1 ATP-binding protein [Prosthecobacter sp.]
MPSAPEVQFTQRLGWHSLYSSSPDKAEWVELNLGQAQSIDAVVLIAPPPNGAAVSTGYGFPLRFYVELLGEGEDNERTIIADYTGADFPNPGLLPIVIPTYGGMAQKVRITATRLYSTGDRSFCALGEVMLLQGNENLGARLESIGPAAVRASSSQGTRPDWGRINLVDGHTVLGPPLGTRHSPTLGFRSVPASEGRPHTNPWVELDLGQVRPIDEIRFFPAYPPQFAHSHGYGFPVRYQIELREADNDTPHLLPAPQSGSYNALPGDNVVTLVGARRARFIRMQVLDPHVSNGAVVLAMAEMQVWSDGKNIALGCEVNSPDSTEQNGWSRAALVDGFASGADIVDWPGWLAALSTRREVEQELSLIAKQREIITQHWQKIALVLLIGMAVAGVIALLLWLQRQRRIRRGELERLRERIAHDLHDEIGSSLGSIALIAQDILAEGGQSQQSREDLTDIKDIAAETVDAMRDITRLMQSERYGTDDLPTLLRETADRMLRGIQHTLDLDDHAQTRRLSVDRQRDLMLMFKEALHNITRHAAATEAHITLKQTHNDIILTIRDNGHGFDTSAKHTGMGLTNLQRRAAKHQGSTDITSAPQGTVLILTLPLHA